MNTFFKCPIAMLRKQHVSLYNECFTPCSSAQLWPSHLLQWNAFRFLRQLLEKNQAWCDSFTNSQLSTGRDLRYIKVWNFPTYIWILSPIPHFGKWFEFTSFFLSSNGLTSDFVYRSGIQILSLALYMRH